MRRVTVILLLSFFPLLSLLAAPQAGADFFDARVVAVFDGDTIEVLADGERRRIRLAGIDTPERGQPWGNRARKALSDKVFGKPVTLEVIDRDRYGRTVAQVYRGDRHINRELVREGHAWVYRKYLRDESLLEDEEGAREAGRGLWGLPEAAQTPPWEWRAGARNGVSEREDQSAPFTCGTKRYCREMVSCAEARFYMETCGLGRLDGDRDGVPCEKICR